MSHVTRHTSHVTHHTSHVTRCAFASSFCDGERRLTGTNNLNPTHAMPSRFTHVLCKPVNHACKCFHVSCLIDPIDRRRQSDGLKTPLMLAAWRKNHRLKHPWLHVRRHTSHVACLTSHITRHTSHVTRHTLQVRRSAHRISGEPEPQGHARLVLARKRRLMLSLY